ncbi:MAG: radical SAM protein [Thermoanaerobaculaceae bacterium]|nr:radical SAM protein [Thermoanaerobaculaceae bacterium]
MSEKIGLYIHIPFCQNRCSYCDFYKEQSQNVEDEYIDFLIREALFYKEENKIEIDTIYFGGGTPSLLSPEQLSKLFEGLQEIFFFL